MQLRAYLKANRPFKIKQGHFTTAYLYHEQGKVILESRCYIKECMALGWFPDSELFPSIKFADIEDEVNTEFRVYEMPLYVHGQSVKRNVCKEDYEGIYVLLRKIRYVSNYADFEQQLITVGVSKEVKEDLLEAYEACTNYGSDVGWEISPRNVAATSDGKLILLDCFYIKSQLRRSKR
jgi:hypothetical protein